MENRRTSLEGENALRNVLMVLTDVLMRRLQVDWRAIQ